MPGDYTLWLTINIVRLIRAGRPREESGTEGCSNARTLHVRRPLRLRCTREPRSSVIALYACGQQKQCALARVAISSSIIIIAWLSPFRFRRLITATHRHRTRFVYRSLVVVVVVLRACACCAAASAHRVMLLLVVSSSCRCAWHGVVASEKTTNQTTTEDVGQ